MQKKELFKEELSNHHQNKDLKINKEKRGTDISLTTPEKARHPEDKTPMMCVAVVPQGTAAGRAAPAARPHPHGRDSGATGLLPALQPNMLMQSKICSVWSQRGTEGV